LAIVATPAAAIDWNRVDGKIVPLFHPGQASWEWVLTQSDHSGAKKFRGGKNCKECHQGEEHQIGDLINSGKKLEPLPLAGRPGSVDLTVKTTHDGDRLYFRLEWSEVPAGGAKMDPEFAAKVTIMLEDGSTVEGKRAGCWGACHADLAGMANDGGAKLTKYLTGSRTKVTRKGGGENYKIDSALTKLLGAGKFFEYWQARLNQGSPAKGFGGYALEKRHFENAGDVSAEAQFQDGKWAVVLSRKMKISKSGRKNIVPGGTYHIGFAVHDGHAGGRYHYVSFEHTLAIDAGGADFVATRN
jgi:cytochrome c-type protein NapC